MIRKIIPLSLPVLALVGGAFAGDMLRAPKDAEAAAAGHETEAADAHAEPAEDHAAAAPAADDHGGGHDAPAAGSPTEDAFFTFPTQFFVPLVRQGDMRDVMILTLTLKTDGATLPKLAQREHSLRDALLRQLMIHANTGGFDGNFTADRNLATLRDALVEAAHAATDLPVAAVLIEDIVRQPG